MYDVVVVGARCAGASLAMLLARRGYRIALVDRARFPSDTISSHFLWPRGAARLQSWGLLNSLGEAGCRPLSTLTFDFGPVAITGGHPPVGDVADMFCPRRTIFDKVLVDAAVAAGAELIEGTSVGSLRWSDGAVCGVDVASRSSGRARLDARVVVGADGRNSLVARAALAKVYEWSKPRTVVYYSYWSGLEQSAPTYHVRSGRVILRWPTNNGLTCIYVGAPHADFLTFRDDIEGNFMESVGMVPGLREAVAAGRRAERFRGAADLPNFYRQSFGPGWALAGDAGHHKDPITGFGMSDALASADTLAEALDAALSGRREWQVALGDYQKMRDQSTANGLRLTLRASALEALPRRRQEFYEAAAEQPEEVTRIIGALSGAIPADEVFSASNIQRVISRSLAPRRYRGFDKCRLVRKRLASGAVPRRRRAEPVKIDGVAMELAGQLVRGETWLGRHNAVADAQQAPGACARRRHVGTGHRR